MSVIFHDIDSREEMLLQLEICDTHISIQFVFQLWHPQTQTLAVVHLELNHPSERVGTFMPY